MFYIYFKEEIMAEKWVDAWLKENALHGQSNKRIEAVRQVPTRDGLVKYLAKAISLLLLSR
jgi:hypothetical protein